ncbi:DUF2946 family protein [Herbaspirillum sp. YR522]|uniref:DUF2946 family protein n=1 Tax=Herbaspirillum sp. YR522 TaxID=1144342 RepID=UPI00026F9181|nr:DUF2946 family protein [Herbaspirillum sp. YR522]EJM98240.1 Protein of unknown function (DUF2946) [Herbaspirillum sp. YR522]
MDEVVRQAMAKWPNVPHCFGWLRLDARGAWRMRDERAQQLALPGERIVHPALLEFINRNYGHDEQGRWYFQNGPQRVFVDLELTPFIIHTQATPTSGEPVLVLHTGEPVPQWDSAAMDENGRLYLRQGPRTGALDDRDMVRLLPALKVAGRRDDDALLQWIEGDHGQEVRLELAGASLAVEATDSRQLAQHFGFVALPR